MTKRIIYFVVLYVFTLIIYPQEFHVKGNISTSKEPVRYALVTFINSADTTKTFTTLTDSSGNYIIDIVTAIKSYNNIPTTFELAQNYPNPFSSSTAITYTLNKQSDVLIKIYNILGQVVKEYSIGTQNSGAHGVTWDGRNELGNKVASGVYLYQLKSGNDLAVKKMIISSGSESFLPFSNSLADKDEIKKSSLIKIKSNTYAIQITNNVNTSPFIITGNFSGISIERDTTLSFLVKETLRKEDKMYIVDGDTIYLLNNKTFEIFRKFTFGEPVNFWFYSVCLSTNRDYLFTSVSEPREVFARFVVYDILQDTIESIYTTQFEDTGPNNYIAAQDSSNPGLVFIQFRDHGLFSLDMINHIVKDTISLENSFTLAEFFFDSPDRKHIIIKKNYEGSSRGYSELEYYTINSGSLIKEFVLNKDNADSLRVYNLVLSQDLKQIYFTFLPGPVVYAQAGLGSYNLETKQIYRSELKFPWSLIGYFLSYSPVRDELYILGANNVFYIIDPKSYTIKDSIYLSAVGQQSPILIRPDNNIAFVGYPDANSLFVIDLEERRVVKIIKGPQTYYMVIP